MDHWKGRVALVTGASVGIGASICVELVKNGMIVVGCARNVDRIKEIAQQVNLLSPGRLVPVKCDLSKESDILSMFQQIRKEIGRIDVCINNAGLTHNAPLINGSTESWRNMLDVNIMALCICTRESIKLMQEKSIDDGQIIHISSIAGHKVLSQLGGSFYSGSKHMVRALTEGLRQELRAEKSGIRVACISPGLVETEFMVRLLGNPDEAKKQYSKLKCLQAQDIADAIMGVLKLPPHVEVNEILIYPTEQNNF